MGVSLIWSTAEGTEPFSECCLVAGDTFRYALNLSLMVDPDIFCFLIVCLLGLLFGTEPSLRDVVLWLLDFQICRTLSQMVGSLGATQRADGRPTDLYSFAGLSRPQIVSWTSLDCAAAST